MAFSHTLNFRSPVPFLLRLHNQPPCSTAITAVGPCEDGCRYALRILVLMQEEKVSPDRFTLSAIGKSVAIDLSVGLTCLRAPS